MPFVLARQNVDGSELEFGNMLIEDANNDAMSYVDCESNLTYTDRLVFVGPHLTFPKICASYIKRFARR